jgi:hypothetical protein
MRAWRWRAASRNQRATRGDDADRQLRVGMEQQGAHGGRKPFRLSRRPQEGAGVQERVHRPAPLPRR